MSPLAMDPQQMRALGYRAVDAIVDRWVGLREDPPWRGGERGELEALFREAAPEVGAAAEEVLDRAVTEILARAGRIDHPRFLGFVPSSPVWPSVVADVLNAGYNVFQGTWLESAGPSQVELVVVDWIREWIGYPEGAGGLLTSGGSAANLDALVTAREAAGSPTDPVVYLSDQGHSSLERAAYIAGVPRENVRRVPTDEAFRLDIGALERMIAEDRAAGRTPLAACANAGATNTGAVDPLPELAELCRREGIWFHVDAAYGGFIVLTDEGREVLEGLELADSVTLDPHKWLFQPFETGCLLVRDVRRLVAAFRILPEYLQDTELGEPHVNFADRGLQLTRSFRALRIWMSVKTLGLGAFRTAIATGMELAREAGRYIEASPDLEMLSAPAMGVVCFRYRPAPATSGDAEDESLDEPALEALNEAIQSRVVEEGTVMMSSTRLRGTYSLRFCVLNFHTTVEDIRAVLARIEEVGREICGR